MDYIIIGTDHDLQKSDSRDTGLRDKLQAYIRTKNIVLIAEEVDANKHIQTFGRDLVGDGKWLSIDMPTEERKRAGIYQQLRGSEPGLDPERGFFTINPYYKRVDGVRERFWLDKIEEWCNQKHVSSGVIIVTCGYNHPPYLADKIRSRHPGSTVAIDEYLPYDKEAKHGVFEELE
jgi:hypothetical protein